MESEEHKWNTLFDAMTEMVVLHELVYDKDGKPVDYRITDCNKTFTTVTGIKKEDAVGKLATEVYQDEEAPYLDIYSRVAFSGKDYQYTTYYQPMDKHFVISVVSPEKGAFATITTDITAIKQVEELVTAKNEELENYLYIASHDLRSPLVNIQGFSQRLATIVDSIRDLLSDCSVDKDIKKKIDQIVEVDLPKSLKFIFSGVAKMDKLISGLLQISRTGRVAMTNKSVNMNILIKDILTAHRFQLEEINAIVDVGNLPDCFGDSDLLNQLFSNLITNAIKYKHKSRRLEIVIRARELYNQITYSVKDNGIGISPGHLEKIWDVFFQVNPAISVSGDGIGLSIVKRITDKHYGKVNAESDAGKGTIISIELRKKES